MTLADERPLKIGKIPYLNLFPIFYWIENLSSMKLETVEGPPSVVNAFLREGIVDVSPSSSVLYLKQPEEMAFFNGHSISSRGPVMSIVLVSKYPLKELNGKVALSPFSESSNLLLRVVLERFYGLNPRYITPSKQDLNLLATAEGVLFIGDEALKIKHTSLDAYYTYDLGEVWTSETGLPAVFALWIYKKNNALRVQAFKDLLDRARDWSMGHLNELARVAPLRDVLGEEAIVRYWKNLSYELDEEHMKGLELFGRYINELSATA